MKVRKFEFLKLLEMLIDNNIMQYGEIKVSIWDKENKAYKIYHHCGLGTFTGIGYQYVVGGLYVDSFSINHESLYYEFWLSDDERMQAKEGI